MIRRTLLAFLAILSALLLGCHARDSDAVRVGIEAAYPPFMEVGPDGNPRGFEIELAAEIFSRAQQPYELSQTDFAGLLPGLEAGKFDAVMASINITEERRLRVDFTVAYYRTPARFVRAKGNGVEDTREGLSGRTIGVQGTTNLDEWLTRTWGDIATVVRYPTQDALYLDMRAGRVDAMFSDEAAAEIAFLRQPGGEKFEAVGKPLCGQDVVGEGVAIALAKGRNPELLARLDAAIRAIHADGTYDRIQAKFFDFDLSCDGG